mmetsp:Transcript_27175/g.81948  ORF Transcript_27175/g.81948 Transcript_27175/m.81948 type:complete len:169 (-) Transcript_27175:216-722(-)
MRAALLTEARRNPQALALAAYRTPKRVANAWRLGSTLPSMLLAGLMALASHVGQVGALRGHAVLNGSHSIKLAFLLVGGNTTSEHNGGQTDLAEAQSDSSFVTSLTSLDDDVWALHGGVEGKDGLNVERGVGADKNHVHQATAKWIPDGEGENDPANGEASSNASCDS